MRISDWSSDVCSSDLPANSAMLAYRSGSACFKRCRFQTAAQDTALHSGAQVPCNGAFVANLGRDGGAGSSDAFLLFLLLRRRRSLTGDRSYAGLPVSGVTYGGWCQV